MIEESQIPSRYRSIIDDELGIFKNSVSVTSRNSIPETSQIPIENPSYWLKIPDVVCIFVDMIGSTKLSATNHQNSTAKAYRLFSSTAVRLFSEFEASYIDLKGDGVFALFDPNQVHRALAAAVTFKTFAKEEFVPKVQKDTNLDIGFHGGIDQKTVLVRKVGFKRHKGRTDRQNEVWAGKTVNMASKLAAEAGPNGLAVSARYFDSLSAEEALRSCGCPDGEKVDLWTKEDVEYNPNFDFKVFYKLTSCWCAEHRSEYCRKILDADEQ